MSIIYTCFSLILILRPAYWLLSTMLAGRSL
jgi:hypothetical protein